MGNMYENTATWNPFVGCLFDCIYCKTSFQAILHRFGKCHQCRTYYPHAHPERGKIPNNPIVFIGGTGDISYANPQFVKTVLIAVNLHAKTHPNQTYYLQSKDPLCLTQYVPYLNNQYVLLTTLETNRDQGYEQISRAPPPSVRARDFKAVPWNRKIITIEPIMDFDEDRFLEIVKHINPEAVYIGFNSKRRPILPEPSMEKTLKFIHTLEANNYQIRPKNLKGELPWGWKQQTLP